MSGHPHQVSLVRTAVKELPRLLLLHSVPLTDLVEVLKMHGSLKQVCFVVVVVFVVVALSECSALTNLKNLGPEFIRINNTFKWRAI